VILRVLLAGLVLASVGVMDAMAQTLVGNPFVSSYQSWVDPFPAPTRFGNWRLSLHNPNLIETNNANPPTTGGGTNTGRYEPNVLIHNTFLAPANYELSATMRTNDDDLLGLVWNFQDANNYFRVGLRQQPASGNFGGTEGVSVQKVAGGVVTQLFPVGNVAGPAAIDQAMIDSRTPFDVKVAVNGTNYEVFFNGTSYTSGTDAALASGRKIGLQSWAQQADAAAVTPFWGTEVESVLVKQGATTLFSETFGARPIAWRPLVMTNQNGVSTTTTASKEDIGNFGLDVNDPWILQHSNGFEDATFSNVDFIGPAVVVNEPGSAAFTNYQLRTRIGTTDNDGVGVLVRAQDDNNFYRVTFTNEPTDVNPLLLTTRAPRGMSVQKVRNGTWTELYRDDSSPLFVYTPGAAGTNPGTPGFPAFDLSVGAVGNQLKIQVRDHQGNVINYPLITDNSDPILSGTVGLQTWGTDNAYYTGYGGQAGPLLTTLTAFTDFDATVNRTSGNITLTNNGAAPVTIRGITIGSSNGALNPASWMPVATFYDEAPGNGTVDPNDPWTITSSTALSLSEREQSVGGDGATVGVGQSINLGNAWIKSRIEDVTIDLELFSGGVAIASVDFSAGPGGMAYHRSDLNVDGVVNASDWPFFYPNMLTDMSALTGVQRALKGDLNGDGDNDVVDFDLFKADYESFNGPGSFEALLGVPEPSALALVLLGGLAIAASRRRAGCKATAAVMSLAVVATVVGPARATPVDFTTFTVEAFPKANDQFPVPNWNLMSATATPNGDADASVAYTPDSALNKRFVGRLAPRTDDDVVGFVLGFEPGDAQIGSTADYLLIDWKGATQTFNFVDGGIFPNLHHDQTLGGSMPVGLALSRVTGSPTADELWQHADLPENATGGVAQLARGATLGSTPYANSGSHLFDITYTSTRITVSVDGVPQLDVAGSFPDGRFGLFSSYQSPAPIFSDFKVFSSDFDGLSAVVDRSTGSITLRNTGEPFQFDFYQLDSASDSLNVVGWNSLSDQNFQTIGPGEGQSWDEAGGSSASALGEVYLRGSSTLATNESRSIGNAYNTTVDGGDLALTFRLPTTREIVQGTIQYAGDYDGDSDVDGADFLTWQRQFGGPGSADGSGNGVVDGADLQIWKNNLPGPSVAVAVPSGTAVPEPSSIALVTCAAARLASQRRRSR
jgi:hypothetical protein